MQSANLPGVDIDVMTVQLQDTILVYEITASVGGRTETQRHAIGASGTNAKQPPVLSPTDLQVALDGFRQAVADSAAWHAAIERASGQIT